MKYLMHLLNRPCLLYAIVTFLGFCVFIIGLIIDNSKFISGGLFSSSMFLVQFFVQLIIKRNKAKGTDSEISVRRKIRKVLITIIILSIIVFTSFILIGSSLIPSIQIYNTPDQLIHVLYVLTALSLLLLIFSVRFWKE